MHILLTANKPDVNLCKLILTSAVLGYPAPAIVAWNQTFHRWGMMSGGSHLAKITEVLKYLEALGPEILVDPHQIQPLTAGQPVVGGKPPIQRLGPGTELGPRLHRSLIRERGLSRA